MTKEEAKQKLRKAGYQVVDDNSVVTVLVPDGLSLKAAIKDVKGKLIGWGYESSFGLRHHSGEIAQDIDETEDITEEDMPENQGDDNDTSTDIDVKEEAIHTSDEADAKTETSELSNEEDYLDEDENSEEFDDVKIDEDDMDMLLNEDSIQFSLEDFGLN